MKSLFAPAALFGAVLVGCLASAQTNPSYDPTTQRLLAESQVATADEAILNEDGGNPRQLIGHRAQRLRVTVFTHQDIEYQTNADLNGRAGEGSLVYFPAAGVKMDYRLKPTLSLTGRVQAEAGIYDDVPDRDFWGVSGDARLNYRPQGRGTTLYIGSEAHNYESLKAEGHLSGGVAPLAGIGYVRYLPRASTHVFADVHGQYHFTTSEASERVQYTASIGATRLLTSNVYLQGYYATSHADYEDTDRRDRRNIIGLNLVYSPRDTLQLRTGVTFIDSDSTLPAAEYQSVNYGLGGTLAWRF
jgi:hypothetical protein